MSHFRIVYGCQGNTALSARYRISLIRFQLYMPACLLNTENAYTTLYSSQKYVVAKLQIDYKFLKYFDKHFTDTHFLLIKFYFVYRATKSELCNRTKCPCPWAYNRPGNYNEVICYTSDVYWNELWAV